ncbi:15-cis-phytoene desaturase, chloroplastic/chromoplastic [Linum perenne]
MALHLSHLLVSPIFNLTSSGSRQTSRRSTTCYSSPTKQTNKTGVIVVGAGLAGLAAATHLHANKIPFLLLEASDAVGGRVRTDIVDGFLLDRGFQIFITAYPEARKLLNYQDLDLRKFYSGARIYYNGQFHTVADPLRHFSDAIRSLTNPIGSVLDKLLIGSTRIGVLTKSDDQIFRSDEVPTSELLNRIGFSDIIVSRFFKPFFGGIFFDPELETTSRLFEFIFKCLALGENTLPAKGIGAIPDQLASKLPAGSILLNSKVASIQLEESSLTLENGESFQSELGLILAVDQPQAMNLLQGIKRETPNRNPDMVKTKPARCTVCVYFWADRGMIPIQDPVLFLNGSGQGIVNNMFFATNVAESYGPENKVLISVSLIGLFEEESDENLAGRVLEELSGWFGESVVGSWNYLRTYRIRFAQPNQSPPTDMMRRSYRIESGLYVAGDYLTSATFDGALVSGRKAVEELLRDRDR